MNRGRLFGRWQSTIFPGPFERADKSNRAQARPLRLSRQVERTVIGGRGGLDNSVAASAPRERNPGVCGQAVLALRNAIPPDKRPPARVTVNVLQRHFILAEAQCGIEIGRAVSWRQHIARARTLSRDLACKFAEQARSEWLTRPAPGVPLPGGLRLQADPARNEYRDIGHVRFDAAVDPARRLHRRQQCGRECGPAELRIDVLERHRSRPQVVTRDVILNGKALPAVSGCRPQWPQVGFVHLQIPPRP